MNEYKKETLKEILMKMVKNEIRISYEKTDEPLAVCSSKIGGKPAVPHDFVWPRYSGKSYDNITKERPLAFLAQINLEETGRFDTEKLLPETGILSFFYEVMSMPWGFSPEDNGSAKVYYFPRKEELIPMDIPDDIDEEVVMPEFSVTFKKQISLPEAEDFPDEATDMEFEWEDYDECREECGYSCDEWGEVTKLLGYPDTIQSSMEEECEALARGFRQGCPEDFAAIPKDIMKEMKEKSKGWMLLFQMGTIESDDMEYMFGDCGHIYYWIRKQDLEHHNFEQIWLILQCS